MGLATAGNSRSFKGLEATIDELTRSTWPERRAAAIAGKLAAVAVDAYHPLGATTDPRRPPAGFFPRVAIGCMLAEALASHKPELLALLSAPEAPAWRCRCGGPAWQDIGIHGGQSLRRACGSCGRFVGFSLWHGRPLQVDNRSLYSYH